MENLLRVFSFQELQIIGVDVIWLGVSKDGLRPLSEEMS
jgi:hypothetical protein